MSRGRLTGVLAVAAITWTAVALLCASASARTFRSHEPAVRRNVDYFRVSSHRRNLLVNAGASVGAISAQ